jgi:hypothetical protein
MHLLCPHCQHPITVPDTSAGQTVECPLCGKPFPAPALSLYAPQGAAQPAPAATPPGPSADDDDRTPYDVAPPTPNRVSPPAPEPPRPSPPAPPRQEPAPPPPTPPSTAAAAPSGFSVSLHLPVVRVITAVALVLGLLLTFFPWSGSYPAGYGVYTQTAWQALFGTFSTDLNGDKVFGLQKKLEETVRSNLLLLPYLLLLLAVVGLAVAEFILPHLSQPLPPRLQRLRPESYALRHAIMVGLLALATILLLVQLWFNHFGVERALIEDVQNNPELVKMREEAKTPEEQQRVAMKQAELLGRYQLDRRIWLTLAVLAHIVALFGLAAEYWLYRRGNRPEPRLDLIW